MAERKFLGEVKDYSFSSLTGGTPQEVDRTLELTAFKKTVDQNVLSVELKNAQSSGFLITSEVKEHRGLAQYEMMLQENRVKSEVDQALKTTTDKAFTQGYEQGLTKAQSEIEKKYQDLFDQKVAELSEYVAFIKQQQQELLEHNKTALLKMIKMLTCWVLNRELDDKYVERLLPKMLGQIQHEQKILIKLDVKSYEKLSNAADLMDDKFKQFNEIRVAPDEHISHPGVIIESESSILNATLDNQFKAINEVFDQLKE